MVKPLLLSLLFSLPLTAMYYQADRGGYTEFSESSSSETDSGPGTPILPTRLRQPSPKLSQSSSSHALAYKTVYGGPTSVMALHNDPIHTPVLGRARTHLPTRTPLSRSISVNRIVYGAAEPLRLNDPRLEEYVRLLVYENDRDEEGVRFEAMRVLIGVKIFKFPHERIVRVVTRSTGPTFETLQTMQIIGLPE